MSTYYVTKAGYETKVPIQYHQTGQVVGLAQDQSVLDFVLKLKDSDDVELLVPPNCSRHHWHEFENSFKTAMRSRDISKRVLDGANHQWTVNTYRNKERILAGTPVHLMDRPKRDDGTPFDTAVIVGNGPSLYSNLAYLNYGIPFVCWHAYSKVKSALNRRHFVGHCDSAVPFYDFSAAEALGNTEVIATPNVAPEFLSAFPSAETWVYLGQDCWHNSYVAAEMGSPDHRHVVGTIVYMLAEAAIYAGCNRLVFVGVDLGTPEQGSKDLDGDAQLYRNRHGVTGYTNSLMATYKTGLEMLASENKGIEFLNTSKIGVDIEGFKDV